jgi:hypothetical protein
LFDLTTVVKRGNFVGEGPLGVKAATIYTPVLAGETKSDVAEDIDQLFSAACIWSCKT